MAKIIITLPNSGGGITNHNNLLGLQGGNPSLNEFYHLTLEERDGLINLIDNPVTPLDFDNGLRLDINTVNLGVNPDEEFLNGTPGLLTRPTGLIFGNISTDVSLDYTGLQISGDNLSRTSSLLSRTFTEGYDLYSGFEITNVVNNGGTGTSNFITYFDDIEGTKEMSFNISHNASGPGYINKLEIRDDSNLTGITTFGDYSDNQILEDNAYITTLGAKKLITTSTSNKISQGGDSFGTNMIIGTNDANNVIIRRNGGQRIVFNAIGTEFSTSLSGGNWSEGSLTFATLSAPNVFTSSRTDSQPVLAVQNTVTGGTNDLIQFKKNISSTLTTVAGVRVDGRTYGANATVTNDYVTLGQIGIGLPNGVATLDGGGKIPASQLPNSVMTLEGEWNASTNTPILADGTGNAGMVYEVTVAGTQNLGSGNITFAVGDWVVYGNDGLWYKSLNSNEVTSVNGYTGTVVLTKTDIGLGNVDNTSDLNKPISTATQTALNLKANDADVIHRTGVEGPIIGQKNFTNSTSSSSLSFTNTSIGSAIAINNTGSLGLSINNNTGGITALNITNTSTTSGSAAINILNTQNNAINMSVQSASTAMFTMLQDTARGIVMYGNSTGDKIYFLSPSSTDAFKVDAVGNTTANSFIKIGGTASQFLKADGSVDSIAYAPINSPTFTGTVTIPSAGLTLSGGSVNNVIQGNGVPTNTATLVRNIIISTNNGVSTTIVANSTNFNNAVWQLQNQVNNRIALASDNAVAGLIKVAYMTEAQYASITPNADTAYFIEQVIPDGISNITTNATNYTISYTSKRIVITLTGSGTTLTLPPITGGEGVEILIINRGNGSTINTNTGANDIRTFNGGTQNTYAIQPNSQVKFYNNNIKLEIVWEQITTP